MASATTQSRTVSPQRYGEMPVAPMKQPSRPWEEATGSGDAIAQWRETFVCLRCVPCLAHVERRLRIVGKAIGPEGDEPETVVEEAESDEENFGRRAAGFRLRATRKTRRFRVRRRRGLLRTSPTRGRRLVRDRIVPDSTLRVDGRRPPTRETLLPEEEEEIICADGVYDDYLALSRWPETDVPDDPDDEFPPFVVVSTDEAQRRIRAALLEAAAHHDVVDDDDNPASPVDVHLHAQDDDDDDTSEVIISSSSS